MQGHNRSFMLIVSTAIVAWLLAANPALAYLGPGVGLEFAGYFMALLATVGVAFLSVLLYPIYAIIRFFRGPRQTAPVESADAPPAERAEEFAPK